MAEHIRLNGELELTLGYKRGYNSPAASHLDLPKSEIFHRGLQTNLLRCRANST
jgi:hypothetical protein